MTVCTQNQEMYFDQYPKLKVLISEQWQKLPQRFPNIELDEFVVMPNHIHGIIFIYCRGGVTPPLHRPTLEQIIAYFKYQSTKLINQWCNTPGTPFWQRNYYEHIIWNENSLNRIREYIRYNPLKWDLDRENPARTGIDEFDKWLYEKK